MVKNNLNVISTKLLMPVVRKNYIKRNELFKRLDNYKDSSVVIVKGGAGRGKTTLLTSYINKKDIKNVLWINLDSENNNIYSFWYYFIEAFKNYLGTQYEYVIKAFNTMLENDEIKNVMVMLINNIEYDEDLMLVLDDFQFIKDDELIKTIEYFIKYIPQNLHIVFLTREEPKLELNNLRMKGKLIEIDENELKLSDSEGREFIKNTLRADINDDDIINILTLSEGWIGGIQLMSAAFSGSSSEEIRSIHSINKYVVEYLSKEILESLNSEIKDFLIKTSILEYFSEDICNLYLGKPETGKIINYLIDRNLFIINLDEENKIYRYHNLFEEFLRQKFSELDESEKIRLHNKASCIYESLGDFEESIKHAIAVENYKQAFNLIRSMGQNLIGWVYLDKMPVCEIIKDEDMTIQLFFYCFCRENFEKCRDILEKVQKGNFSDGFKKFINSTKQFVFDDLESMDDIDIDEIGSLNISSVTKAIVFVRVSFFIVIIDKYDEALKLANEAIRLSDNDRNYYIKSMALMSKAQILEYLGRLNEASDIYNEFFKIINDFPFLKLFDIWGAIGAAGVCIKQYKLNDAKKFLNRCRTLSGFESFHRGYEHTLMTYYIVIGDKKNALCIFKKIKNLYTLKNRAFREFLEELIFAMGFYKDYNFSEFKKEYMKISPSNRNFEKVIMYCRVLTYEKKHDEALKILEENEEKFKNSNSLIIYVKVLLLKASIFDIIDSNDEEDILNCVRKAVGYSYKEEIISLYIYEGRNIPKYLDILLKKGKDLNEQEISFIRKVLNIFHKDEGKKELLSPREIEVLKELSTGASNKEISERLCISLATVKTHIINIYSKLNVKNRVEATKRGKEILKNDI